jgi:hypothetical protein
MWHVTKDCNGVSATELQRLLGLGSYRTAWAVLHKLRRAMAPHIVHDQLRGVVEVRHTCWGRDEGVADNNVLIVVAAEEGGIGLGRIRLRCVPDLERTTLHGFIAQSIASGSKVRTDGLEAYRGIAGYVHDWQTNRRYEVDRVVWSLKCWLLAIHQGSVSRRHLDSYLDEFTFRFDRRPFQHPGSLFHNLIRQAVQVEPVTFDSLTSAH